MNRPKIRLTIEVLLDAPLGGNTIAEKAEKLFSEVRCVVPSAEMMGAKVEAETLWEKNEASDSDDVQSLIDTAYLRLLVVMEMVGLIADVRRDTIEVPHLDSHTSQPEPGVTHVVRVGRLVLYRSLFNGVRVWTVCGPRRLVEPGTRGSDAFLSEQIQICRDTEFRGVLSVLLNSLSSEHVSGLFNEKVEGSAYQLKVSQEFLGAQNEH